MEAPAMEAPAPKLLRHLWASQCPLPVAALWSVETLQGVDVGQAVEQLLSDGAAEVDPDGLLSLTRWKATGRTARSPGLEAPIDISPVERSQLRGSLGAVLRRCDAVPTTTVADLVLDGLAFRADSTAIPWVFQAANRELRDGRLTSARALLERAIAAIGTGAPVESMMRLQIQERLAFVLRWLGDGEAADRLLDRAVLRARESNDPIDLAIAATAWTPHSMETTDDPTGQTLLDAALAALPDDEPVLRARLLAFKSSRATFLDLDEAQRCAEQALDLARTVDDAETFIVSAFSVRTAFWHPSNQQRALDLAAEMIAAAPESFGYIEVGARTRLQVFLEQGEFGYFDSELVSMAERLAPRESALDHVWLMTLTAARHLVSGHWDDARAASNKAVALSGSSYDAAQQLLIAQLLTIDWQRGDDLRPLLDHRLPVGPLQTAWESTLLGWTCRFLDPTEVEAELDRLLVDGFESIRPDLTFSIVAGMLCEAAATIRSERHAGVLYDGLVPYADQWAAGSAALSFGPYDLHLGRLADVLGRSDDARAHLESALVRCEDASAYPWIARTELALAQLMGADGGRTHAKRAAKLAARLEMVDVVRQAEQLLDPSCAGTRPAGLSRREVEVLGLLAGGSTNRQIAEELCLSLKTIERHLVNAYRKIDAGGRADATAFAIHNDLV